MKINVKTKINATDISQLTGQKVSEVIQDKLNYLIDKVRNEPPHIIWVTKNAFIWGGGKAFDSLNDDNPLKLGFITTYPKNNVNRGHLPIRRPSNRDLQFMEYRFGMALDFPPPSLFHLIQTGMRRMEKALLKTKDVRMLPCNGYINKEGKLIQPGWNISEEFNGNMISGYFLFCIDDRIEEVKRQLIDDSDVRLQLQFERAKYSFDQLVMKRARSGESIQQNAQDHQIDAAPYLKQLKTNHPVANWDLLLDKKASNLEQ